MKQRIGPSINEHVLTKFKEIACTKTMSKAWFGMAVEEAMIDYIVKNGGTLD